MTKKLLLAAVGAAVAALAFQASADQPFAPRANDENDTSWLFLPSAGVKLVPRDRGPIGAPFLPYANDENDTSWMYAAPPRARVVRSTDEGSASAGSSRAIDENVIGGYDKALKR